VRRGHIQLFDTKRSCHCMRRKQVIGLLHWIDSQVAFELIVMVGR
jgi:hypothetical protein